jgi:hypothetical protein
MANLILSINDTYYPNSKWHVHKYYTGITNDRVVTAASSNLQFDVFGTRDGNSVKIIAGSRPIQAPYDINISGFNHLSLGTHESIEVHTYRFDWADPQDEIYGPVDLGTQSYSHSSGTVSNTTYQTTSLPHTDKEAPNLPCLAIIAHDHYE